jgi:hypothetical protein
MKRPGKPGMKMLTLPLLLSLVLIATSCASTASKEKKHEELLKESVEAYISSFRWEDYKQASLFVPPTAKESFWAEVDRFKGKIRITDYELREVEVSPKGDLATVFMRVQFWRTASPVLKSVSFNQKWYYNEKAKIWLVGDTGFRAITGD